MRVARHLTLASMVPFLVLVAACPTETPDDGGAPFVDAGSIPDLVTDAGAPLAGDLCALGAPDCPADHTCVPRPLGGDFGTCRRGCGTIDGASVARDPAACVDPTTSCQVMRSASGSPVAVACLPVVTERDGLCFAAFDPAACDREGMALDYGVSSSQVDCAVTIGDESGPLHCKIGCDYGFDDECPAGEACLADATGELYVELTIDDDYVYCTTANDCAVAEGFACTATDEGDICAKPQGTCAIPVPAWGGGPVTPELVCNVVDDHAGCDDRRSRIIDGAARVECDPLLGTPVCIAYCTYPGFDYDDNGVIEDWEGEEVFGCLDDRVCSGLLGIGIDTDVPCGCPEGTPCPSSCGAGSTAECSAGKCRAVFKTCVDPALVAPPVVDGGAPGDAGAGGDAGGGMLDAGLGDAGPADGG